MTAPALLAYEPTGAPPAAVAAPAGWSLSVDLARFGKLDDFTPALAVLLDIESEPGASMELWLTHEGGALARWSGGRTDDYRGDACFQLPLASEDGARVIPLAGTRGHAITVAFRDAGGRVVVAVTRGVAGFAPQLAGEAPAAAVFRDLLACPS